jgi:hypothetical protein
MNADLPPMVTVVPASAVGAAFALNPNLPSPGM